MGMGCVAWCQAFFRPILESTQGAFSQLPVYITHACVRYFSQKLHTICPLPGMMCVAAATAATAELCNEMIVSWLARDSK